MKTAITRLLIPIISFLISLQISAAPSVDKNRYANSEDAAYWNNVNEGDYLFFVPNTNRGNQIYSSPSSEAVELEAGKKILIYKGSYERIYIDGSRCENSREQPTVITNFGGQLDIGYSENNDNYRGLILANFDYVHLSGKYDPVAQTGHEDYRGHDAGNAMGSGYYYEKYGIMVNPRFSGERFASGSGNLVRAYGYLYLKIDYVASWGGGFASFNLKQDHPTMPSTVEVVVEDNFAGFTYTGEGFYISYSTSAVGQDATLLTMRNNIVAFPAADGLQTDNLAPGSVIENNVVIGPGQSYRSPFDRIYHDNAHQFSFVASDVIVQNNIYYGVIGYMIAPRHRKAEDGRFTPNADLPIVIENNYFGYGADSVGYVWEGDGITQLKYINNVFGPIDASLDDSYTDRSLPESLIRFGNSGTPITLRNNIYPKGKTFFKFSSGRGNNLIENTGNIPQTAPLIQFMDLGFDASVDPRSVAMYKLTYGNTPDGQKNDQAVSYGKGDIVHIYDDNGIIRFFECLEDHLASDRNMPLRNYSNFWKAMTWDGRTMPPLDVRLQAESFYNYRKMGLTYSPASRISFDQPSYVDSVEHTEIKVTRLIKGDKNSNLLFRVQPPLTHSNWSIVQSTDCANWSDNSGALVGPTDPEEPHYILLLDNNAIVQNLFLRLSENQE